MDFITPEQAEAYDRWYAASPGHWADRLEKEAVFELLPPVNGLRFIDAGCGTGNITKVLATRGAVVVGLDPSAAMLSKAKLKAPEGQKTIVWVRETYCSYLSAPIALLELSQSWPWTLFPPGKRQCWSWRGCFDPEGLWL